MGPTAQRLNRGEKHAGIRMPGLAVVAAQVVIGSNAAIGSHRLIQNFLPVGHKQHPIEPARVEGAQPSFAEAGSQHYEAGFGTAFAAALQSLQGFPLNVMRLWDLNRLQRGRSESVAR